MQTELQFLTSKNDKQLNNMKKKLVTVKLGLSEEINKWQKRLDRVNADLDAANDRVYAQKKRNRDSIAAHIAKHKGKFSIVLVTY